MWWAQQSPFSFEELIFILSITKPNVWRSYIKNEMKWKFSSHYPNFIAVGFLTKCYPSDQINVPNTYPSRCPFLMYLNTTLKLFSSPALLNCNVFGSIVTATPFGIFTLATYVLGLPTFLTLLLIVTQHWSSTSVINEISMGSWDLWYYEWFGANKWFVREFLELGVVRSPKHIRSSSSHQ